jgi:hypothetical protein
MAAVTVSPELVLVDRELREAAIAALPHVEPFDFLRFTAVPRRHSDLERFNFLAEWEEVDPPGWVAPIWVAAPVYALAALAKVVVVNSIFIFGIAAVVALMQLAG